ncbi:hypothetical protein KEM63_08185 [Halopseudomonas nanhaiensis]|uniref:hypothetical protein n=1 Tax=Halopseudomonas nanhaiensis TaxID=2830842 RepID=UPI001CC12E1A|nr:hypothetical protein [Halopseudomonas nanhaiensis]UAW96833.1 hypothetical protein KEM63_08185 [Halopseudomonas nanhaiensis]
MSGISRWSLPTAVLAATLALGAPSASFAQQPGQPGEPGPTSIIAGHTIVDAVDDVRGATAGLVASLLEGGERLGIPNWEQQQSRLQAMQNALQDMEDELDQKADATDASWLSWLEDDDYTVTVTRQIRALGDHLDELSSVLGGGWDTSNMQVVVGHEVLDQLDELRETTGDLLGALSEAGSDYGWRYNTAQHDDARQALDRLEQNLNRKREGGDADLLIFMQEQQYHTLAHENVQTIADILSNILHADKQKTDGE